MSRTIYRQCLVAAATLSALLPAAGAVAAEGGAIETGAIETFQLVGLEVEVLGEPGSFQLTVETSPLGPDLEVATLRISSPQAAEPPELTLKWSLPSHDIHGVWTSGAQFNKSLGPDWYPSRIDSTMTRHAPVISLFGADDGNRLTFAVSEALNPVKMSAGVREEDARVYGVIELFTERHRPVEEYEVELRFDRRSSSFSDALADVSDWWAAREGFEPAEVPETARLPMYSTWYSYHQSVSAPELLREMEIGKALGFDAIIIDDGWQTLDSQRGYAYTGDWRPERMPEMKAFVDTAHDLGVAVLLWYSLPLVGEKSEIYDRFEGKYLRYWDGQGASVLDPRYPEVRAHIIDTYRRAMADWGVDGFKLDFLGFLVATDETELTVADGRDFASVNDATDRLMTDIMVELRKVRPDIMIEFRQPYIGPLMRKYGNMFRAGDTPGAAVENRVRTVDLRLLSGDTAVHSDMFMWHYDEPVEVAALQILNILFSVPQLSVRLEGIPEDHRQMVSFYTDYWRKNRDVLLDGDFVPHAPLANYPMLEARNEAKRIVGLYADLPVRLAGSDPDRVDVVNSKASASVVVDSAQAVGPWSYAVFDALGQEVAQGVIDSDRGLERLDVPSAGLLVLQRTSHTD